MSFIWEWITANWLALYGAIVGTCALFVNASNFLHGSRKEKVRLIVSCHRHPEYDANIARLHNAADKEPWNKVNLIEVYEVVVRNTGSVLAHLEAVGVICSQKQERLALVPESQGGGTILVSASASSVTPLAPKSSRTFRVYLRAGEKPFTAIMCYATDQTGKRWTAPA